MELSENQLALIFYSVLILLIILFRKKFTWQGIAGMYKTKVGLKLMEKWGVKYRGIVQLLGVVGIGVGFVGMAVIAFSLVHGLWVLVTNPAAPAVISPVIPGVNIPGAALKVPLITGWLALFVVIVIHEFSHGVVSRAHNIPVKSSGLLVFGPIAGAFVEPDEKQLVKQPETVQYALFAAGPFSNIVTALLFGLVFAFLLTPLYTGMTVPGGVEVVTVTAGLPAGIAALPVGATITSINSATVKDYDTLSAQLDAVRPGDVVTLGTDKGTFTLTTIQNPTDAASKKGYLGVTLRGKRVPKLTAYWFGYSLVAVSWLLSFFQWLLILSLGIGLANLLPLGPVDGGRMLQTASRQVARDKKRGDWWWARISIVTLVLLLVLLFVPIGRAILT